jgi:hypothetical protein
MTKPNMHGMSLAGLCLTLGLLAEAAAAGVSVAPLRQELTVKPGQTTTFQITVSNNRRGAADTTESVCLEMMDVAVAEDGALAFGQSGARKNSASRWITLKAAEVTLDPGRSQVVECRVTAPHSAAGEYYAAILATLRTQGRAENGVSISYRIASGVFVTVAGRSFPRQAKITQCAVVWPEAPPAATTRPADLEPAKVAVVLQNTGQARFDAGGKVSILDARSRTVFTAPLCSKRPCVFGGDSRRFEAALTPPLPAGRYVVNIEMDYQSGWARARHSLPLEITPEKAEWLKAARKAGSPGQPPPVRPVPEKLSARIPAGAFRCLTVAVRNGAEEPADGLATFVGQGDRPVDGSWVTVRDPEFTVGRGGQKTLELIVRVPAGATPGPYGGTLVIDVGRNAKSKVQIQVPVELHVDAKP